MFDCSIVQIDSAEGSFSVDRRSRKSGKKSISSARASFAAVRNEKFTSWRNTFVIYGFDTFMRRASSDWLTPSSRIRRRMRRKNAEPI